MNLFARWWKFNVVGVIGAGIQLVLLANLIAILCCSAINFCLGHCWAFA